MNILPVAYKQLGAPIHKQPEELVFALAENSIFDFEKTAPIGNIGYVFPKSNLWLSALAKFQFFGLFVYNRTRKTRYSFALAEVCVAVIIIGISVSYVFSSLQQTIQRYSLLRQEICCHELADEYLGRFIATFLTSPPDLDTTVGGGSAEITERNCTITMQTTTEKSTDEETEAGKEVKKKAYLICLTVTVTPIINDRLRVSRSTTLCITQEGL